MTSFKSAPRLSSARVGRVGELRAEAKLLELGCTVAHPSIDNGVDLIVNGNLGVQVKSSQGSVRNGSTPFYVFSPKIDLQESPADVFVFYGLADDIWWVIPRVMLLSFGRSINLTPEVNPNPGGRGRPSRTHQLQMYRDAWHLFDFLPQHAEKFELRAASA